MKSVARALSLCLLMIPCACLVNPSESRPDSDVDETEQEIISSSDESFAPTQGKIQGSLGTFTDVNSDMTVLQIHSNTMTFEAPHLNGKVMVQFSFVESFADYLTEYPVDDGSGNYSDRMEEYPIVLSNWDHFVGIGCQGDTVNYWDVDNPIEEGSISITPIGFGEWQLDYHTQYRTTVNQDFQHLQGTIILKE